MHFRQIEGVGHDRTFAVIFDTGDEVAAGLKDFAKQEHISAAHFTAIGAFSDATLAYFDWEKREYEKIPVNEQCEVLMLAGDISLEKDQPKVHTHVVLGTRTGNARGGHLLSAHVRPTLELMLTESPAHLHRKFDPQSGLALIAS